MGWAKVDQYPIFVSFSDRGRNNEKQRVPLGENGNVKRSVVKVPLKIKVKKGRPIVNILVLVL